MNPEFSSSSEIPFNPPEPPPSPFVSHKLSTFRDLKGEEHTVQFQDRKNLSVKPPLPSSPDITTSPPFSRSVSLIRSTDQKETELPSKKPSGVLKKLRTLAKKIWGRIRTVPDSYENIINLSNKQLNSKIDNKTFIKHVDENLSPENARLIKEMALFKKQNHHENNKEFEVSVARAVRFADKNDWAILSELHPLPLEVEPIIAKKLNDRFEIATLVATETRILKSTVKNPQENVWMIKAMVHESGLRKAHRDLKEVESALTKKSDTLTDEGETTAAIQIEGSLQTVRQNLEKLEELHWKIYKQDINKRF